MPTPVLASLLPTVAVAAEWWGERREEWMFPEERTLVAGSVASRRASFSSARACARRALAELGYPPAPVLRGPYNEPLWPEGVHGSITHCRGYVGAAVAAADGTPALGIDAEPHEPLRPGLLALVASSAERDHLATLPSGVHWDRVLFSVKEAVYKAWFPLARRWLDFGEADVRFRPSQGRFSVRLMPNAASFHGFGGRFVVAHGVVLIAVTNVDR